MTAKRIGKKFIKIVGIILSSLLILLTAFHFWFIHHAEELLQSLVESQSKGKIKLEVKKIKFRWFGNKFELENAVFYTTDSLTSGTAYRFGAKSIKLKVKSVWPIVFQKKVLINNLSLQDPDIVVTVLRSKRDSTRNSNSSHSSSRTSLPQEMGHVYKSIQDALTILKVKKFEMENTSFTLINKANPEEVPVRVGKIDFHIDNLYVGSGDTTAKEKIFFSDNIVFKSRDQDILFPNGRHRLSYRKFRINIEKKIVEFDSCTIAAVKTDSSSTGFSIFLEALQMTNIDFDTLYRSEVIKADSVYCINPTFKLDVDFDKTKKRRQKAPKLDEIIRQLTGDMLLNFVVVNNASFDIQTLRNGRPSSFTSKGNNFEMQGLTIDDDAERPLRVKKFAMSIRNYENFLRDSTYEMQFDSVMFNDDRILLNDFTFRQLSNGKVINSFKVPRFQLTGLSWDDLLFERKLNAHRATLFNPVINYTQSKKKGGTVKRRNIFEALADINEVIMLEDLNIVDGDISLHLNGGVDIQLKDATLSVESRALLGSSHYSGIRRSVNYLDFNKGIIKINDMTVVLDGINFTGAKSQMKATQVLITNSSNTPVALAKGVTMNGIFINENTGDVSVSKLGWNEADINLAGFKPPAQKTNSASFISLTDIAGNNTQIVSSIGNKKARVYIDHVEATAFLLKPGEKPIIAGLNLSGKDIQVRDTSSFLSVGTFSVRDEKNAVLENIHYVNHHFTDSTDISIPRLSFVPYIQATIDAGFRTTEMNILHPVVRIHTTRKDLSVENSGGLRLPKANIQRLSLDQPVIDYAQKTEDGITRVLWNGKNAVGNSIVLKEAISQDSAFSVGQLELSLNSFSFENDKGRSFSIGQGSIDAVLKDISFKKTANEGASWQAIVATLRGKNFFFDSLGKKAGKLDIKSVQLNDLAINSSSIGQIRTMIKENQRFRLQKITASYFDSVKQLSCYNAGYDKNTRFFTLDSFSYRPSLSQDSFVAAHPYQVDYIHLKTGAMNIGPFDMDGYLQDTIIRVGTVKVDDIRFTDFRDKRPPFLHGKFRQLVSNRIKSLPFKFSIDTIHLYNGHAEYTELNPKTQLSAMIPVTRINLLAFPVRNYDLGPTDSLRLHANGYLMDSIWLRLRFKESYIDSLAGFLFTLRLRSSDMKVLNPVLPPLASARVRSGWLDTVSLRASGNDYLAYGEMKMQYSDLKIDILKKGSLEKAGFPTFIANTFIVKTNNDKRTGTVFYVRDRERSTLNYLIKLFMSGVTSSIGVKHNRKMIRQYKKELQERNLPPFDYD